MNDNVAAVREIYQAVSIGDIARVLEFLDDDVAWEQWADNSAQNAGVPWLKERRGKMGAAEFFQIVNQFINLKHIEVLSIMNDANQVAVELAVEFEVPQLNAAYRDEELHLWTFNEKGKVVRMRHYTDTAKHILAAKYLA